MRRVIAKSAAVRDTFMNVPVEPSCIKAFNCCKSYNISKFVTTIKRLSIRSIFVLNFLQVYALLRLSWKISQKF